MMSSEGTRITPGDGDSKIKVIEELTNEGSANPSRCQSEKNLDLGHNTSSIRDKCRINPDDLNSILKKTLQFEEDLAAKNNLRAHTSRVKERSPSMSDYLDNFKKSSIIASNHEQSQFIKKK